MEFLNNSGHIFSLTSYDSEPIGYEYDETPYIFWINNKDDGQLLSIKNYYTKVINVLFEINQDITNVNIDDILNIDVKLDSTIFSFIPANLLQEQILKGDINQVCVDYYNINSTKITKHLTNQFFGDYRENEKHKDDFVYIKTKDDTQVSEDVTITKNYIIIPLYIIGYASEPGTWTSNILIHISYKNTALPHDWCPVTVGGTFVDQYEQLYIHGKNMGVKLPFDILRAVNGVSFYGDNFDEAKYNEKLKEYFINFMGIKGERGNYNSAIQSIKWFGYAGLINISKLLQTDNQFKEQFVRDYFDVNIDILDSFKYFLTTQFISLGISLNRNTGELYEQYYDKTLWGERLPILEDLINKKKIKYTDELLYNQEYGYLLNYFGYTISELGLKIAAMKYYLEKYFLPIFIKIKTFSLEYKVYQPDTKFICRANTVALGGCYTIFDNINDVTFEDADIYYFTHQKHYVDEILNEFEIVNNISEDTNLDNIYENSECDWYMINDTCVSIPIKFNYDGKFYNCYLYLFDENNYCIYESRFSFVQTDNMRYMNFILYPKMIAQILGEKKIYNCVNKRFKLCLLVNNNWYIKNFGVKMSEFRLDVGTLQYQYYNNDINYLYYKLNEYNEEYGDDSTKVTFNFKLLPQNEDNPINITNYIRDYDFFDSPTKYLSYFKQIKSIYENDGQESISFNRYMFNNELVNVDNLYFDVYDSQSQEFNNLIDSYRENINIINDVKYLNHIILYDLYKKITDEISIPLFNDTFRVRTNGLEIIKPNKIDGKLIINGKTNDEGVNTKLGVDYYLIDDTQIDETTGLLEYGLKEHNNYMFYLKRNSNYELLNEYDTDDYSYFVNTNSTEHEEGYIIFKTFEDFTNYNKNNIEETSFMEEQLNNIFVSNGKYFFKPDVDNVIYKLKLIKKINNQFVEEDPTVRDLIYNPSSIYLKATYYTYEYEKILNYAGYYGEVTDEVETRDFVETENGATCTVIIKGEENTILENVPLINTKYYYYTMGENEDPVYKYNPSFWMAVDGDEGYEHIITKLNSLRDNWIGENDDIQNHTAKYYNVLIHNFAGHTGTYELQINNDRVGIHADITKNGISNYYKEGEQFVLDGTEDEVSIYLFINPNEQFTDAEIFPRLIKYEETYIKQEYEKISDDYQTQLSSEVGLYKDLFREEYEIKVEHDGNELDKIEIWNSAIPFDNNEFYDMYLMHDKQYWYIIQISKNTLDNLMVDYKQYRDVQREIYYKDYLLKFVKYDTRFLINRMKYISANGYNHFNKHELVVVNITNNRMLPTNIISNTKWMIKPLSIGMKDKASIYGSTNMAIVSVPNNDNAYQSGYYEVNVNYSLSFRFANNQTLKTKILVK